MVRGPYLLKQVKNLQKDEIKEKDIMRDENRELGTLIINRKSTCKFFLKDTILIGILTYEDF